MRKIWKNQPNSVIWIGLLAFAAAVFVMRYGRKEQLLYQEFEEKVIEEQKNVQQQARAEGDTAADSKREDGEEKSRVQDETQDTAGGVSLEGPEEIRIILQNNQGTSYCHEQVVLEAACDMILSGAVNMVCPSGTPADADSILPEYGKVTVQTAVSGEKLTVASLERAQGVPSYEGSLTIWREGDGFCILNTVDLETYLKYVVPSEMPSGYPIEALKAQAVCARTYAVSQIREGRLDVSYGADVDDSVSFQVYNNIERQETTDRAVDETRGEVMASGGEPIQAYFFSTSCGRTSTDEVWEAEETASYLKSTAVSGQAVETAASSESRGMDLRLEENFRAFISRENPDDYENCEPWYRWNITLPLSLIQERAENKWPGIGEIQSMAVEKRSTGGAAEALLVQGTGGSQQLTNEYTIREFLSPGNIPVSCRDGSENTSMSILPSAYICIDPAAGEEGAVTGFSIRGGGYGHGVGLSQNGAKHMAQSGLEYKDVLGMFFQNFDLALLGE